MLLTLGTGVGGAAMVDGVILHGAAGIAGHFGHMTVDVHGPLCMCGNHGCLETHFSSRAIESDYFAHQHRAASTTLPAREDGQVPDTEAIFRAAASGDASAQSVLETCVRISGCAGREFAACVRSGSSDLGRQHCAGWGSGAGSGSRRYCQKWLWNARTGSSRGPPKCGRIWRRSRRGRACLSASASPEGLKILPAHVARAGS